MGKGVTWKWHSLNYDIVLKIASLHQYNPGPSLHLILVLPAGQRCCSAEPVLGGDDSGVERGRQGVGGRDAPGRV